MPWSSAECHLVMKGPGKCGGWKGRLSTEVKEKKNGEEESLSVRRERPKGCPPPIPAFSIFYVRRCCEEAGAEGMERGCEEDYAMMHNRTVRFGSLRLWHRTHSIPGVSSHETLPVCSQRAAASQACTCRGRCRLHPCHNEGSKAVSSPISLKGHVQGGRFFFWWLEEEVHFSVKLRMTQFSPIHLFCGFLVKLHIFISTEKQT